MTMSVGATAETLQRNCDGLVCLITDERSLVGCNMLGWMEHHSKYGMKNSKEWGCLLAVIFLADDIQHPPHPHPPSLWLPNSQVYKCNSSKPASIKGSTAWQSFKMVVTLDKGRFR